MYSVIILAHNRSAYTRMCLSSLLTSVREMEVIVLDNGSSDDTPRLLEEFKTKFHAIGNSLLNIRHDRNIGCSTGRNECMAAAKGDYIVFLDNDTVVRDAGWLARMSSVLLQNRSARIVGPKMCYPFEPHLIQCAGVGISRTGRVQFRGRGERQDDPRFASTQEVQTLISACMMFDAALVREIGGLDEAFNPIQFEDFDFCYRARSRGYKVMYTPDPVVYHWESVTSDGTPTLPNRHVIIKNGALFKRRWRHMFENENGPTDEETKWKPIEMPSLEGRRVR